MSGRSWIFGVIACLGLVGFVAMGQDPLDKKPPQRDMDTRVRILESVVLEQQARLRELTNDLAELSDRISNGWQPGQDAKGKFSGTVKVLSVSDDYSFIQLDNDFGLEVAKESLEDANNRLTGAKVDVYFVGQNPYPYRAVFTKETGRAVIALRVRLVGKP